MEHSQSYLDAMKHLQTKQKDKDKYVINLKSELQEANNEKLNLAKQCKLLRKDFDDEKNTNIELEKKISDLTENSKKYSLFEEENQKKDQEINRLTKMLQRMQELVDIVVKKREQEYNTNWSSSEANIKSTSEFGKVKDSSLSLYQDGFMPYKSDCYYDNDDMSKSNFSCSDLKDRLSNNKENQIINIENMGNQNTKQNVAHLRTSNKNVLSREPLRSRSLNRNQPPNSNRNHKQSQQYGEEHPSYNNQNNYNPYNNNEFSSQEEYRKSIDSMFRPSKILTFQNDQKTFEDYDDTNNESYYGLFPNSNCKNIIGSQQSTFGCNPNEMFLRQVHSNKDGKPHNTNDFNKNNIEQPSYYYLKDLIDIIFSNKFELYHFDKIREIIKVAAEDEFSYTIMIKNQDSISEIKNLLNDGQANDQSFDLDKVEDDQNTADWLYGFTQYLKSLFEG